MSSLEALAELQDLDVRLSQLQHRLDHLPELAELAEFRTSLEVLATQQAEIDVRRDEFMRTQRRLEDDVAGVEEKVAKSSEALYGGAITSPKEASAMQDEIASLGRRQAAIEDEILELMEHVEPLDADLEALAEQRAQIEAQMAVVQARVDAATEEIDGERGQVEADRSALVAATPDNLVEMYEQQRVRMRDRIAVGRLIGATCGACHLDLSAVDLDHIRELAPDVAGECPECGALLVH